MHRMPYDTIPSWFRKEIPLGQPIQYEISFRDLPVSFAQFLNLITLPDTTLTIYLGLGQALKIHWFVNPRGLFVYQLVTDNCLSWSILLRKLIILFTFHKLNNQIWHHYSWHFRTITFFVQSASKSSNVSNKGKLFQSASLKEN